MKDEMLKSLPPTIKLEIIEEVSLKIKKFDSIVLKNPKKYEWILDREFVEDLILTSIFYRRIIYPLQGLVNFFNIVTTVPISQNSNGENIEKIFYDHCELVEIGLKKIGIREIESYNQTIENFYKILKTVNFSPEKLFYKNIEEFLDNIHHSLEGMNNAK